MSASASQDRLPLPGPFTHVRGEEWLAAIPTGLDWDCDTVAEPVRSRLRLFENGRALGPLHCGHIEIAEEGAGRYSHWDHWLRFSTSDGSDPNSSGSRYEIALGPLTPAVVAMGTCHLHQAMKMLVRAGRARPAWLNGRPTYSPTEVLQVLRFALGHTRPESQADAVSGKEAADALNSASVDIEAAMLEFNSSADIVWDGMCVSRDWLQANLINPLKALGPAPASAAQRWYSDGLLHGREDVRCEMVEALRPHLAELSGDLSMLSAILEDLHGVRRDPIRLPDVLDEIISLLPTENIGVAISHDLYTREGRAISWSGDFPLQMTAACRRLALTPINVADLLKSTTCAEPLMDDHAHFFDAFAGEFGEVLLHTSLQALDHAVVA